MTLRDEEYRKIAKNSGMSPEACRRILGNLSVSIKNQESRVESPMFNPGLRLAPNQNCGKLSRDKIVEVISKIISDYKNSCPQVVQWICRGDFNPQKIPEQVTLSNLKHATRTAGRLRAELMRALG